jgi:tetratricopeptide (TPR) repeat protein
MSHVDLEAVRALKSRAAAERNRGRLDRAQQRLDEAIGALQQLRADTTLDFRSQQEVQAELADTFGMKGGVHRRENRLDAALDAYRDGLALEQEGGTSTYNLGNVIALSIVELGIPPEAPLVSDYLSRGIELLSQATRSDRRDEWWAWADLAQFFLLAGQPDKAREAYAEGRRQAGPSNEEIKRHSEVLLELARKTAATSPKISTTLQAAAQELIA